MKQLPIKSKQPAHAEPSLDEFRKRILLDRNDLDNAASEQAALFLEVCDQHTAAVSQRDNAKEELARVDAELASNLRKQNTQPKLSESAVYDLVIQNANHQQAYDNYETKKRTADFWGNLRLAFEQRAKMLHELVSQYSSGYFTVQASVNSGKSASEVTGRTALHIARTTPRTERK